MSSTEVPPVTVTDLPKGRIEEEIAHLDFPTPDISDMDISTRPNEFEQGISRGAQLRAGFTEALTSVKAVAGNVKSTAENVTAQAADIWERVPVPVKGIIREAGRGALYGAIGRTDAERAKNLASFTTSPRKALVLGGKRAILGGVEGARRGAIEAGANSRHIDLGVHAGRMAASAAMAASRTKRGGSSRRTTA